MKLDEFRSGRFQNKAPAAVVLIQCGEIEREIGFGSFHVVGAAARKPGQHSQSAHFCFHCSFLN